MVSSGLPTVLDSQPLPSKRLASSGVLCGWMNSTAPSSSALARNGWNFGSEKSVSHHAAADRGAFQSLLLDRVLELLRGEVGKLQGQPAKAPNRSGRGSGQFGEMLVVQLDDLGGDVTVLAIPVWVDRQDLHIDRHGVHELEPGRDDVGVGEEVLRDALRRRQNGLRATAKELERVEEVAVRVGVDRLDALAADADRQASRSRRYLGRSLGACARAASSRQQEQKASPPAKSWRRVAMVVSPSDWSSARCEAKNFPRLGHGRKFAPQLVDDVGGLGAHGGIVGRQHAAAQVDGVLEPDPHVAAH